MLTFKLKLYWNTHITHTLDSEYVTLLNVFHPSDSRLYLCYTDLFFIFGLHFNNLFKTGLWKHLKGFIQDILLTSLSRAVLILPGIQTRWWQMTRLTKLKTDKNLLTPRCWTLWEKLSQTNKTELPEQTRGCVSLFDWLLAWLFAKLNFNFCLSY